MARRFRRCCRPSHGRQCRQYPPQSRSSVSLLQGNRLGLWRLCGCGSFSCPCCSHQALKERTNNPIAGKNRPSGSQLTGLAQQRTTFRDDGVYGRTSCRLHSRKYFLQMSSVGNPPGRAMPYAGDCIGFRSLKIPGAQNEVVFSLGVGSVTQTVPNVHKPPGFLMGLVHGFISLFSLVGSLFLDIRIYGFPNSGSGYDVGFVLGAALFYVGDGLAAARSRAKDSPRAIQ